MITTETDLLLFTTPVLLGVGGLLAYGHAAVASSRQHALVAALAVALAAALVALLAGFGGGHFTAAQVTRGALAIAVAQLIAAPLLDRARLLGLVAASLLGAAAVLYALINSLPTFLPPIPHTGWLLVALLSAALAGLFGSALVAAHPARLPVHGLPRLQPFSAWRFVGLALLALGLATLAWLMEPEELPRTLALSAMVAALLGVVLAPAPYKLSRAAEGLLAGCIGALLAQGDAQGIACGVLAALGVERGRVIAAALQLDDPSHSIGTVLWPALLALLWPGLMDLGQLATYLRWLGSTLALTALISMGIWPLAKLTFGLAASPRRIREGLDH